MQIRARVWGHLAAVHFTEGAEVKQGDLLFTIDQRSYRAALARAEADVAQADARLKRLLNDYARAQTLISSRAISREELDKIAGDLSEAQAATQGAQSSVETAKLNLGFTEVRAPVADRASRALVTIGNMVQSGETGGTVLTTLVSTDPVHVYFDVDDLTYLRLRKLAAKGGPTPDGPATPVLLGLPDETGFPYRGALDFSDNQLDPSTGTLKMRGVFRNADRLLTPGLFVRVRLRLGSPRPALLVADRAVDTDQGQKVLFVVNPANVVEKRRVQLGKALDGLREIVSGLKAGERVVVDGLQRVQPGAPVLPQLVDMLAGPEAATAQAK